MARIRSIQPGTQDVKPHSSEVDCFHQKVRSDDGILLHLSTFGSDDRQSQPKSSQSLQLDRDQTLELARIIHETFE